MRKRDFDIILRLEQEDNRSEFIRNCIKYYIEHEDEIREQERQKRKEKLEEKLDAL